MNLYIFSYTEAMTMGKLHKEIGQLIVQSAEDPDKSDSQVIKVNLICIFTFKSTYITSIN